MGTSDEWARSLGEEIKSKERVEADIAQTVAMHRQIEAEKMPLLWDELIAAFQEHCTAYNEQVNPPRKLYLHRTGPHNFMVRPDALPEIVKGNYNPQNRWIEVLSSIGRETYFPQVEMKGSGEVHLTALSTKRVKTPSAIARDTLRECLIAP